MLLTPASSVTEAAISVGVKGFSCLLCRQRKVRCDQHQPCSNCTKAGKECSFVAPVRGKRKRNKPPKEGLHAKLQRYEELLKSLGAQLEQGHDDAETSESGSETEVSIRQNAKVPSDALRGASTERSQDPYGLQDVEPILLTNGTTSRYLDNDVWARLGEEQYRQSALVDLDSYIDRPEIQKDLSLSTATEQSALLLQDQPSFVHLAHLHPPKAVLPTFQEIFKDRVDPLMKILHLPSFFKALDNVNQNPENVPRSLEALVFNFYLVTVSAFVDEECISILGAERSSVYGQYKRAARQSLVNAEFLSTSNFETLQAFTMFMMGVRSAYRYDTLYMFSGVGVRLGRKMGLHRDGATLGLPFYEAEMRRRLWWHLVHLDFRLADTLSTRPSMDLCASDTALASNIEDEDFEPGMVEKPPERKGITSVVICRVRSTLVEFFRNFIPPGSGDVRWEVLSNSDLPMAKKDAMIREIESHVEETFLRYCDITEPLHILVQVMVRSAIAKMRLFAHNPRQYVNSGQAIPQSERDIVFTNASKLLEYAILVPGNTSLEKYMWQISTTYLWNTMLYMLIEARHRKTGPEVDQMWKLLASLVAVHPHLFDAKAGPVASALRKWILEVWNDYVMALRDARMPEPAVPGFISEMRQSLKPLTDNMPTVTAQINTPQESAAPHQEAPYDFNDTSHFHGTVNGTTLDPYMNYDFSDILAFEADPNEWSQWENLISGTTGFQD